VDVEVEVGEDDASGADDLEPACADQGLRVEAVRVAGAAGAAVIVMMMRVLVAMRGRGAMWGLEPGR
jgi:hypothetical protein